MQRNVRTAGIEFKKVWPIFWKPCLSCDQEFRLESGWQAVDLQSGLKYDTFVCNACAATAVDAHDRHNEWRQAALRFIRPKAEE